jgi:hypothetical protein
LEIVQCDTLAVEELDLFKAIIRWALYRKKRQKTTLSEMVTPFLPYIRFPLINGIDLMRIVRATKVVPIDMYIEALEFASAPNSVTPIGKSYESRGSHHGFNLEVPQSYSQNFAIQKLKVTKIGGGPTWTHATVFGDKKMRSGVHYWEIRLDVVTPGDLSGIVFGITTESDKNTRSSIFSQDIGIGMSGNQYHMKGTSVACAQGDRIGILLDFHTCKMYVFRNGKIVKGLTGDLKSGTTYYPVFHLYYQNNEFTVQFPGKIPSHQ